MEKNSRIGFNCFKDETETENDMVNHPNHYCKGGIECIDTIKASMTEESFEGFLKGNIMKYIYRYESKNKPLEDLEKAKWYLDRLIEELEENYGS